LVVSNESHLPVPIRVGVIGAGQLARMMGEASHEVGVSITVLASSPDDSAVATCDGFILGEADDAAAIEQLSEAVDVVTFDHELVDLDHIVLLEARGVVVRPSAAALRFAVDKAYQRQALRDADVPVPRFLVVRSSSDVRIANFLDELNGPPVIKAARGGYDGRGVLFPVNRDEAMSMIGEVCINGEALIEERLVLQSEVAQVVGRAVDGSLVLYPLVTTVQSEGMCVEVRFPAETPASIADDAAELSTLIATLVDVVGILAIEYFVTNAGLVVNEVALRPHNSGHWTIEGAHTSQYANHLRAVSGQPLGEVTTTAPFAVMVNVVGGEQPSSLEAALDIPGAYVHDYGKAWRPGRKLGHVTVLGDDAHSTHVTAWKSARAYGTRTRET
jgi:5-(carboxyamino)imidazole ribonucleotide synthase